MYIEPSITDLKDKTDKPSLIIIRGIPGSGKSTIADAVKDEYFGSVVLSADMWHSREDGTYKWDREKLHHAHRWCYDSCRSHLHAGVDVIVANTFLTWNQMSDYIHFAYSNGFGICLVTANSKFHNIHNVPEETMIRMNETMQSHQSIVDQYNRLYNV